MINTLIKNHARLCKGTIIRCFSAVYSLKIVKMKLLAGIEKPQVRLKIKNSLRRFCYVSRKIAGLYDLAGTPFNELGLKYNFFRFVIKGV